MAQELATCAVGRLEFQPEIRNGRPAESGATLTFTFEPLPNDETGRHRVTGIESLLSPPRMGPGANRILEGCLDPDVPRGALNRFTMQVTIDPEGRISDMELPAGAPPWMERTAACGKQKFRFLPGSRDGVPVASTVSLPFSLDFGGTTSQLVHPQPPGDAAMIEAAFRACYPPDQLAMGTVHFNFDVNADGSVGNAKIVRSSGDPVLDEAATCILPRLTFTPMRHAGTPVKSNITWELPSSPAALARQGTRNTAVASTRKAITATNPWITMTPFGSGFCRMWWLTR